MWTHISAISNGAASRNVCTGTHPAWTGGHTDGLDGSVQALVLGCDVQPLWALCTSGSLLVPFSSRATAVGTDVARAPAAKTPTRAAALVCLGHPVALEVRVPARGTALKPVTLLLVAETGVPGLVASSKSITAAANPPTTNVLDLGERCWCDCGCGERCWCDCGCVSRCCCG